MICKDFREVVKRFRKNHKYLATVVWCGRQPEYRLSEIP